MPTTYVGRSLINTIVVARTIKDFSASFERAIEIICDSLSVSRRRVYQNAYRAWRAFSAGQGFAVMDVTFDNIRLERELLTSAAALRLRQELMIWYKGENAGTFADAFDKIGADFVR